MNQMAFLVDNMLSYDQAALEDIDPYKTSAWLAETPCTVKGMKGSIWPKQAMLEVLSKQGG